MVTGLGLLGRHKRLEFLAAVVLLVFLTSSGAAAKKEKKQQDAPPSPPAAVTVPVVVLDGSGKALTGLQQADFTLEVNGKPQTLTSVRDIDTKPSPAPPYKTTFGQYSNGFNAPSTSGMVILVLDTVHTRLADESNIRQQCVNALHQLAENHQSGWLLTNSMSGLHVYHDFRLSPEQTTQAIEVAEARMKGGSAEAKKLSEDSAVATDAEKMVAFLRGADSNPTPIMSPLRLMPVRSFEAMGQIAQASAGFPGRKSLVWMVENLPFSVNVKDGKLVIEENITSGASLNGQSMPAGESSMSDREIKGFNDLWRATQASLDANNVAVYPLIVGDQGRQGVGPLGVSQNIPGGLSSTQAIDTRAAVLSLAEITGGRPLLMVNDIVPFVTTAAADSSHFYLLGYTDDNKAPYRRINVKVRGAGKEFAPAGGVSWPNATEKDDWEKQNLITALGSPIEYSGVRFAATMKGIDPAADKKKVSFRITLPPDTDTIDDATSSVNVDVVLTAYDSTGKQVAQSVDRAGGQFNPDVVKQLRQVGLGFTRDLDLSPGEYHIKIAIKNNFNGHIGTVAVPVSVK
ncbi:MAG TPA: VWA domain-containing protein [Terriglobales bacterium]|nr:VWA domain-containing protein [Terriglobales bacterium]